MSALKLTTALYYTPSGRSIQTSGIVSNIILNDLKINSLSENAAEPIYLDEAELKGHLKNRNTPKTLFSTVPINNNDLVKNDYQLFQALNLLKGLVVLQNSHSAT